MAKLTPTHGTKVGKPSPEGSKIQRFDRPGHLEEGHAERLLRMARASRGEADGEPFVETRSVEDDLAQEIAEAAVATMTSGEDFLTRDLDEPVDEETGGPFVETSGHTEFASGTDESNIAEATREPVPLANHMDGDGDDDEDA